MTRGTAWSVRGVDDKTREAAIEAARRSGLSVGEWLRQVLADDDSQTSAEATDSSPENDRIASLDKRLQDMEAASLRAFESLKRQLERKDADTSPSTSRRSVADMVTALARELDSADEDARSEIESGHGAPPPVPNQAEPALADRAYLDDIRSKLDRLLATRQPRNDPSPGRIDAALGRLERRLDRVRTQASRDRDKDRPAEPAQPAASDPDPIAAAVAEINRRQSALDHQAAVAARDSEAAAEIVRMRQDFATLARQIETFGQAALESRSGYAELARRIDGLAAGAPLQAGELDALRKEVHAIAGAVSENTNVERARLDTLGEEVSLIRNELRNQHPLAEIDALRAQIEKMAGSMRAAVASVPETYAAQMRSVDQRVDDLAVRIDEVLARAPGADVVDMLRAEIAGMREELAHARPDTRPLEAGLRDLTGRVDELASTRGTEGLSELETRVSVLASDLERRGADDQTLRHIESGLADMQARLASAEDNARATAQATALETVRAAGADSPPPRHDDVVRNLRRDLESLRLAAGDTDRATDGALRQVNATITEVADRLAQLETLTRAGADHGDSGSPAPAVTAPEVPPVEPAPASQASPEPAPADEPADPKTRRANFIAAARRAAQAAAVEAETAAHDDAADDRADDSERTGPFRRISQALHGRKKSVLLAAAAVVIAIGAMQLYDDVTRPAQTDLIASTDGRAEVTFSEPVDAFSEPVDAALIAPSPGADAPALIPPSGSETADLAFAEPSAIGSRFVKDPAPDLPTSAFAPATAGAAPASALPAAIASPSLAAAAEAGDPAAAFEIAQRYAAGERVERDWTTARQWYQRAADGGLAVAQFRLGSLYERGLGGERDLVKAGDWYQRAADQGHVNAMHNLAVLMSEGIDGQPDHTRALQWFRAAADYGVADSQYNLGVLYARGIGQEPNLVESYKWFAIAAAGGDSDAAARRDEIADILESTDLGRARAAVQAWSKREPLIEANAVGGQWSDAHLVGAADRQALVQKIQSLLADHGFDPGPADGLLGPRTRDAVLAFQRTNGLSVTGQIDQSLLAALESRAG